MLLVCLLVIGRPPPRYVAFSIPARDALINLLYAARDAEAPGARPNGNRVLLTIE